MADFLGFRREKITHDRKQNQEICLNMWQVQAGWWYTYPSEK